MMKFPRLVGAFAATGLALALVPLSASSVSAAQSQSVFAYGDAAFLGSTGTTQLNQLMVGIAATPSGNGYWTVAADGGIFSYGGAAFAGSMGGTRLNASMVGMAATPSGNGYWTVAADGGMFSFGDAQFFGSTGAMHLNQPVVGMAATPDGGGYWLVARDGGIFAFGDAGFFGSTGAMRLNQPVVGMAAMPDGGGYWLVASDGGIFSFGDAQFYGSMGGVPLDQPVVGMASNGHGGYWLVARDGGIFTFGSAPFQGSAAGTLTQAAVGIAGTPSGNGYWLATAGVLRGPSNIPPIFPPGLAGEGQWAASPLNGLYTTFLQPYPGASPTHLAWMSTQSLRFALYAGTDQPTGSWPNEWVVPASLQPSLVAAFNSGFQLNQAQQGWYEGGGTGVPLSNGLASLVIYQDGSATVGKWGRDVGMSPSVYAVRQNLTMLVDNGQIPGSVTNTSAANIQIAWGATLGGITNTWRSALCVDRNGNLIYGAGPGLDPLGLARVMQAAGCFQAMELDINPQWPVFVSYPPSGPDQLMPGFYYPPNHFTQNINERDFIAAFSR